MDGAYDDANGDNGYDQIVSTQTIVASISEEILYGHCHVDGAYDDDNGDNGYDQIAPKRTIVASISKEN